MRGPRYSANVAWPAHHNDFAMTATGTGVTLERMNRHSPAHIGYGYVEFRGAGAQTAQFALNSRGGFDDGEEHHEEFFIGFHNHLTAEENSGGIMPIETNLGGGIWEQNVGTEAWFGIEDDDAIPVAAAEVAYDWALLPAGLNIGDRFRLIYVTSGTRNANNTGWSIYNDFVQAEIAGTTSLPAGSPDLAPFADKFRAVISVNGGGNASVNAGLEDGNDDVPIYWVHGTKVADDNADFLDGTWDDESNPKHADGSAATISANGYWTGSESNARRRDSCGAGPHHLRAGSTRVNIGRLGDATLTPLGPVAPNANTCSTAPVNSERRPLYALSREAFTVTGAGAMIQPTANAAEGSSVAFTVTIPDPAPAGGITVPYTLSNGRGVNGDPSRIIATGASGGAGADYDNDGPSVVIAQGDTTATISVPTTQDSTYEEDHYFTVTLGAPTSTPPAALGELNS